MSRQFFSVTVFMFVIFASSLFFSQRALAATRTWDGGGSTNNWSEAANWSEDTLPGTTDTALFNGTSTKDSIINQAFSVTSLQMNAGYTGTITQAANLTHSSSLADFVHDTTDGTFTWSSGTLTFGNNTASTWDVDTDDTFGNVTFNKSGAAVAISASDTVIVTGTLTLNDGTISTGTLEARGPVVHGAAFDGGSNGGTLNITQGSTDINLTAGGQMPITTLSANRIINGASSGTVTFDGLLTIAAGSFVGGAGDMTLTGGLTVSGGSFTAGSGNIDCNLHFNLSGSGAFTSTPGTFFVAGDWTHTDSSTFTHNSGTVTFDAGTRTINVNSTETFNNVTINASGSATKVITSGDTLIVTGTLTLSAGSMGTGTIEARGPVVHGAAFDGGGGTLNITQGASSIDLTAGGQLPFVNLSADRTINGPASGTVTFDNLFTISAGSFVGGAGSLVYTNGISVSGGSFNGGSGTQDLNGPFTLSGTGTFTATSGTMTLDSSWTHTDATSTFAANSGTVVFDGNGATIDVNTSEIFANLTFSAADGLAKVITSDDTLIVTGTLTLTDGLINSGAVEARGPVVHGADFDGAGNASARLNITAGSTDINLTAGGQLPGTTLSANRTINGPASGAVTFDALLTVSAGSFLGGAGDLDLNGGVTLSGGTFTAPSGTMTISGPWEHVDEGSFNHNSGTVIFDGGNAAGQDVNSTETFYNLIFAKVSQGSQIASGDTLVVVGTLTYRDGTVISGGDVEARGDVVVESTFEGGGGPLIFGGSATQSFTLTGATDIFNGDIDINKSGGQVNLASDLVLDASSQDLIVVEGKLYTAGYNVTVNGTGGNFVVQDGGHFQLQGGETFTMNAGQPILQSGSTVAFVGNGDAGDDTYTVTAFDNTYHHLTIDSTDGALDTFQLGSALDIDGSFTLAAGTFDVVSGQNYAMSVGGNWSNTGTFQAQAGTVTFDGTDQIITGTNTFNAFTKNAATAATLTLPAGTTQTFTGALTLTGASTSQRLSVVSATPTTRAAINPQSTSTTEYLSVQDIDNDSVTTLTCTTGCLDAGNNDNWLFGTTTGGSSPTIEVPVASSLTVVRPSSIGLRYKAGQRVGITWTTTGTEIKFVSLYLSTDDGATYNPIATGEANDGVYAWSVPEIATTKGRILIKGTDGALAITSDASDRPFTIVATPVVVLPPLVVEEPVPTPLPEPVIEVPVEPAPTTDIPTEVPATEPETLVGPVWEPVAGSYVTAENSNSVYYVEQSESFGLVLRPFLNAQTFFTYQPNFDLVHVVSHEQLSRLPTDGVMMPKPGVVLVKLPSDERVYALEQAGDMTSRRWIATEELAKAIYGEGWSSYVIDIDPSLWSNFIEGEPILDVMPVDLSIMKQRFELMFN